MKRIYIIKYNQRLLEMLSSIGRLDYKCAHWWGVHPQSHYLQQLLLQILQNKVDQITPPPHKREIVKGFNQIETKQGDSKWIKVTWLKWPLHINVTSIINNFGGKHIQLPAHWSPFARETANSHGVTGCEYHLTVVLPCDGLLALSVQKWWSWLLSPIKRVEAVAALCRISDNSPPRTPHHNHQHHPALHRHQPLSIVFASVLVWEPWFLEQRFGSHTKWWQRQWWDRTRNPKGGSRFRLTRGLLNTQNTKKFCKCAIVPKNRHQIKGYFHIFSTFVNFWTFFWSHFAANFKDSPLRYNSLIISACHLISSRMERGDVCTVVTCNSRVKAAR